MKHITLLFTLFTFTIFPLSADWREGAHVGSAIAAIGLTTAVGISAACTVKHKQQLERLRKELKLFEGHPLRTIYLDNEAHLRLKKSRLATGFFASTAVISIITWLLTLQKKNTQTPAATSAAVTTPGHSRKRSESVPTLAGSAPSTAFPSTRASRSGSGVDVGDFPAVNEIQEAIGDQFVDLDPMVNGETQTSWPTTPVPCAPQPVTPPLPPQTPPPPVTAPPAGRFISPDPALVTRADLRVPLSAPPVQRQRKMWQRPQSPQCVTPIPAISMNNRDFLEQLWGLYSRYPCVYLFGTLPELSTKRSRRGIQQHKKHPPILFDYFVDLSQSDHHPQITSWHQLETIWRKNHRCVGLSVLVWRKSQKKWQPTIISDESFGASRTTGSQLLRLYSLQVSGKMNAEDTPPPQRFLSPRRCPAR